MILGVSDMGRVANTARHRLGLFLHLLLIIMVATAALTVSYTHLTLPTIYSV